MAKQYGRSKSKGRSNSKDRRNDRRDMSNCPKLDNDKELKLSNGRDSLHGLNDFSWYNRNPDLTYAASRIPFPYRPGMQVPSGSWASDGSISQLEYEVPGFATLYWMPTVGVSATATDPASIVGKEIFARVRKVYSGSLDVDAPDFVIYLVALDSIFSYIGALKRIYRILDTYTPYNYYIPDKLLDSMGLTVNTINSLKENRMEFFSIINQLQKMTEKFKCPAVFDYFNRHYWMNDNVYCDTQSPNSQMYVFVQQAYYKFTMLSVGNPAVQAGGCSMVSTPLTVATATPSTLFNFGRSLINALADSDDAYIISGYLMRAFEGEPEFRVEPLSLDEKFEPVYVPEVLSQIENSWTVYHYYPSNSAVNTLMSNNIIKQEPSTNAIVCRPALTIPVANQPDWLKYYIPQNHMSIRSDVPTEQDVVIASRLMACVEESPQEENTWNVICGTEIPIRWDLNTTDATNVTMHIPQIYAISQTETLTTSTFRQLMAMLRVTNFDWSPFVMILGYSAVTDDVPTPFISTWVLGDTHNYTDLSNDVLKNLHRICLYSEFNSFGIDR